jgi:hypothetical protein
MAQQLIGVGSAPNDTTGDPLRTAFTKCNDNFTELYGRASPLGQCRLVYISTTQIRLDRCDGSKLFINGTYETIPAAGVTVSNTGLAASTIYNVYAYMSSGTMTLELSATARATDSTYGHQIKSGDATRTLVGKVRTHTGTPGPFLVSADRCYVISWFNRRSISLEIAYPSDFTTSAGPWITIGAYVSFITWGEDAVHFGVQALFSASAGGLAYLSIALDDVAPSGRPTNNYSYSTADYENMALTGANNFAEGFHYISPYGGSAGGAVTYVASCVQSWAVIRG